MPVNTLGNCNKIMRLVAEKGFENELPLRELRNIIRLSVGSRDDTLKRYFKELVEFGFLEEKNQFIFTIKTTRVGGL